MVLKLLKELILIVELFYKFSLKFVLFFQPGYQFSLTYYW